MEVRHLSYFVTVAECPSFTEAAKRLQVTQSAVSYQIAELERRLEIKLFIRDRHAIRLTRAGEILLTEGRKILQSMDEAVLKARQADSGESGTLKVGFLGSMERVLAETMRSFRRKYPNIDLQVEHCYMQQLMDTLDRDRVEVALTIAVGMTLPEEYATKELFKDVTVAVMPEDHPLASRPSLRFEDLRDEDFVLMPPEASPSARKWLFDHMRRAGYQPRVVMETPSFENLMFLVETGKGITVLSRHIVEFYSNFRVKIVDITNEGTTCSALAIWKKAHENPTLPHFLEELASINY